LGRCLKSSEAGAVYEASLSDGAPAILRMHDSRSPDADMLSKRWSAAAALSHENLIRIFAVGHSEINEAPFVYALMERADETLSDVLVARPLTSSEARETLDPMLEALRYLHDRSLVHGALRPSNVMAVGDTLKLSSDTVSEGAPASDVWALGLLVFQALTSRSPEWREGKLIAVSGLEEPFGTIIQHCLEADPVSRWTIPLISDALHGRVVQAAESPKPATVLPRETKMRWQEIPEEPERPRWIVPAIAVGAILLLILAWAALRTKPEPVAATAAPPPVAQRAPQPVSKPVLPAPSAPVPSPKPAVHNAQRSRKESWFVVVATYSQRESAERRAREITKKWPRFPAHTFAPPVESPHTLVVIGANLSEDEAEALRQRSRAAGLPSDAYIKRF